MVVVKDKVSFTHSHLSLILGGTVHLAGAGRSPAMPVTTFLVYSDAAECHFFRLCGSQSYALGQPGQMYKIKSKSYALRQPGGAIGEASGVPHRPTVPAIATAMTHWPSPDLTYCPRKVLTSGSASTIIWASGLTRVKIVAPSRHVTDTNLAQITRNFLQRCVWFQWTICRPQSMGLAIILVCCCE